MKAAVLALALSLTPVAAEAWAPRPMPSLHKSAPMRAEAAVAVSGGSDARAGPAGVYDAAVTLGAGKAATPISKLIPLSFLSGAHIALGAMLAVSVGGSVPGIKAANPGVQRALLGVMGLPMGLLMVLGAGGELVTGNMAVCTAAYKAGKASLSDLCRNLGTVYLGNFVGSLAVAALGAWASTGVTGGAIAVATGKVSGTFGAAFARGVLCNWLVCMAVWMATSQKDLISKAAAVFFPISGFVAMGLDHSVANMFLIPFGIFCGAEITWADMVVKNLVPVTLGNLVGGAVFVAAAYHSAYGK